MSSPACNVFFDRKHLDTPVFYAALWGAWGLFLGAWSTPLVMVLGLIVYEIVMFLCFKPDPFYHVLGLLYYIFGWLLSRVMFYPSRQNIFATPARPWELLPAYRDDLELALSGGDDDGVYKRCLRNHLRNIVGCV